MKTAAKFLAALALIIIFAVPVEAANITPRRHSRFVPPINVPHRTQPPKEYTPRRPARPVPRYTPSKPQPSRDVRGSNGKNFGPPQAPHR